MRRIFPPPSSSFCVIPGLSHSQGWTLMFFRTASLRLAHERAGSARSILK
ncbi:MAG: hypothetical protein OJF58_005403 [Enhydrobacter sp.]|nr:MAG: hypothetical protein OJF58_005403 [Enhydrobacter sp.]